MQGVATGRNEESSQRQGSAQRAEDEEELAVRVRMMVGRLNRRLERTTAGAGLTSTETVILSTTARRGPVGVSQIAAAEGMNPTMLSRVVRRLEDAGLIVRHGHPEDGRAVVLEATQAGHRLHDAIRAERSDT
ncbi:MAG: hypothetical protein JWM85_2145, partial [Acidimicrobiaceae bacterium]|nr:hypothetical protein [Acidimicrobiaceae bacterium]